MAAKKSALYGYEGVLPDLEIKQRVFILTGKRNPIRHMVQTKHSTRKPLTYFDGRVNRALRYASNQTSPFLDEQDGYATLEPVVFENGTLIVQPQDIALQKFLMIHPQFNNRFTILDKQAEAKDAYEQMNTELEAQIAVRNMGIEELEAVARVALKNQRVNVSEMTSTELKRDMLIWAKQNPAEMFNLLDDENIKLRNVAVRAVEMNILHIKDDQRTVVWANDKRQKVIVAPYGENVYSALASFFKTDEGLDVMQKITNLL
jgi:hypothetical protein